MKQIRRARMSPFDLHKMINKFEATGQLGIIPGRARQQIQSFSVENGTTVVLGANRQSPHGSVNVPVIFKTCFYSLGVTDMPYFSVRKILRSILHFCSYEIKPEHLFKDVNLEVRKSFTLQFLARKAVDVTWLSNIPQTDPLLTQLTS